MAPALFLMGIGPLGRWKKASLPISPHVCAGLLQQVSLRGLVLPSRWGAGARWSLACWLQHGSRRAASFSCMKNQERRRAGERPGPAASTPRATYGMLLAPLRRGRVRYRSTLVKGYDSEKDVRMEAGDTVSSAAYTFGWTA